MISFHNAWKAAVPKRSRKAGRQQRRVVVAEIRAEPGELARKTGGARRQRQQAQNAGRIAHDHDRRTHAGAFADMALPGRQPIEGLEHSAVGLRARKRASPARPPTNPRKRRYGRRRHARSRLGRRLDRWPIGAEAQGQALREQRGPWVFRSGDPQAFRTRAVDNPLIRPEVMDIAPRSRIPIVRAVPVGAWRSPVSAPVWGTGGREFKSRRPDQKPQYVSALDGPMRRDVFLFIPLMFAWLERALDRKKRDCKTALAPEKGRK